ncbi:MAG TPA: hypothetical protein PKI19_08250 [Elusimicrobiales bacterium]|nr:hypothetical protein [Elusimicrobiales bacterium]
MTVDYDSFTRASTFIHWLQGGALLLLGAAEAYALKRPGRRAGLIGPLALLLAGAAGLAVILALQGDWSFTGLAGALALRRGFHLFIAFSCLFVAAGLSGLMHYLTGAGSRRWQIPFLVFLAAIAALYFLLAWRVNDDALRAVLRAHAAIGGALLLAVLAYAFYAASGRRALHTCWVLLLLAAGAQLLAYRENAAAFGPRIVTVEAGAPPAAQPVKAAAPTAVTLNAALADKKRSGN